MRELLEMRDFLARHSEFYIYGAGRYGKIIYNWLTECGKPPRGFCISAGNESTANNPLTETFATINTTSSTCGFILAVVKADYRQQILNNHLEQIDQSRILVLSSEFLKLLATYVNSEIFSYNKKATFDDIVEWTNYIRQATAYNSIVLQRMGGMGDAFAAEPIARALRRMGYKVFFVTVWQELFRRNGSVDGILGAECRELDIFKNVLWIDLSKGHETTPFMSMLHAYEKFVRCFMPCFELNDDELVPLYDPELTRLKKEEQSICVNVEATNWDTRIYSPDKIRCFLRYLKQKGYAIYEIGTNPQNYLGVGECKFNLPLRKTVELMANCGTYIGMDNGLSHLAQSIKMKSFLFFGCVCPNYRIYDWNTVRVMWKNIDELYCAGCYHRRNLPCYKVSCLHDTIHCLDWTVEEVVHAFETEKYNNPPMLHKDMFVPLIFARQREQ